MNQVNKMISHEAMKPTVLLIALLGLALVSTATNAQTYPVQSYPQKEISNGTVRAKIYLPDAQKGFYRGMRFDWAGVIGSLEYKGHNYYGPFFEKFDPSVPDVVIGNPVVAGVNSAASGPVEEFIGADEAALGYAEAKPGETFCKIGVGSLRKPDNEAYSSYRIYTIVDGGKRTLKTAPESVEFTQTVRCGKGYEFAYTKTIRLSKAESVMTIEHKLMNIGEKTINTQVYDHNFLTIDHQSPGPDIVVNFAFSPRATQDLAGLAQISGRQLLFPKDLKGADTFYSEFTGFTKSPSDYEIRVENRKTGAGVLVTGDQPMANLGVWAVRTVVAPEPFVNMEVAAGHEFSWKYAYRFYEATK